jgi:hypothetical protein
MSVLSTLPNSRIDSNSTTWRLRSLVAMGHGSARLARALGVHPQVVRRLVDGQAATVTEGFMRDVRALWEAWWAARPPEVTRSQRIAATRARNRARREDWCAPLGLDEGELEKTGYRPTIGYRPARGLGIADDFPLAEKRIAS